MSEIRISLSNIHNIKNVNIEDIGVFRVRKLGAGEELDLSDRLRRLNKIITELQTIDFSPYIGKEKLTKKQQAEIKTISKRAGTLNDEISEIKRFELHTYKRCFSDDNDGKNTENLLNSLSDDERIALFKQIFDTVTPIESPQEVVAPDEAKTDE